MVDALIANGVGDGHGVLESGRRHEEFSFCSPFFFITKGRSPPHANRNMKEEIAQSSVTDSKMVRREHSNCVIDFGGIS